MSNLAGTLYSLSDPAAEALAKELRDLESRMLLLRGQGKLTQETLELYYTKTRFEQIAESNAIEGSTLSAGETEVAVLKGITISGHDPGYSRDARSLANALNRLAELAKLKQPTNIQEIKEIHELILEGRPSAGAFRNEEIRISGSKHKPPRTWREIMGMMEQWQAWSLANPSVPAPIRSVVLHAWLAHIHPFLDGNGRTSRAIGNLELIRAGYPPIIIRAHKDRSRYLKALSTSDEAGDLSLMFELVLDRVDDALRDLERAAGDAQGYNPIAARIRKAREGQLAIWTAAVQLLTEMVAYHLQSRTEETNARINVDRFRDSLSVDDYTTLCEGQPISKSWAFRIECEIPGLPPLDRLAWTGFRTLEMRESLPKSVAAGPSLFWSKRNPKGYPPWLRAVGGDALGGEELTLVGDQWYVRNNYSVETISVSDLAQRIARSALELITASAG